MHLGSELFYALIPNEVVLDLMISQNELMQSIWVHKIAQLNPANRMGMSELCQNLNIASDQLRANVK